MTTDGLSWLREEWQAARWEQEPDTAPLRYVDPSTIRTHVDGCALADPWADEQAWGGAA